MNVLTTVRANVGSMIDPDMRDRLRDAFETLWDFENELAKRSSKGRYKDPADG